MARGLIYTALGMLYMYYHNTGHVGWANLMFVIWDILFTADVILSIKKAQQR